jgi:hypothetical protein
MDGQRWRDAMSILSRRNALLGSVSLVAILCGALLYVQGGSSTTTLQFSDKEKPGISFYEVKKAVDPYVDSLIERSEKDFKIKYTPADRERIHTRVWDKVRLVFSEVYGNQDEKVLNKDDKK